jgi:hypothetical protein
MDVRRRRTWDCDVMGQEEREEGEEKSVAKGKR